MTESIPIDINRFGMALAVRAWDTSKSKLANKYLGRNILHEVLTTEAPWVS